MKKYYLAIDIGASSGRHILAHLHNGKIATEEIYRFPNGMVQKGGTLCWDLDKLFTEIKIGMKKCCEIGKVPISVGIDTWAVDFVLLDETHQVLGNAVAYRDDRTKGIDEKVYSIVSEEELYKRNGIQKQLFNSIYQLMAIKEQCPRQLKAASAFLMIPDYFHYLLTGSMAAEYTNATTTQLVHSQTQDWDMDLIEQLGLPKDVFQRILLPGSELGTLTGEMQKEIGYNCKVILPATHDTGSAVMAVPSNQEETLYISSGTWSLLGTELKMANCSAISKAYNFTNEGGYDYRFRYLKNIMGLWMIQSMKKELGEDMSFGEICELASQQKISLIVDCNAERFLVPVSMTKEVQADCRESGQTIPEGIAEVAAVIYNSLAKCYTKAIIELESITGQHYDWIYIMGGGANADYLNRLTAKETGRGVFAGPTEATAIGNLAAQIIAAKELKDLADARSCIYQSFTIHKYEKERVV